MFIKCNFSTNYNDGSLTILIELLKFRTNSRIIATYPGNLLWKMWIWVVVLLFSLEADLQGMAKNNPTEKQTEAKITKRH